MVRFASCWCAAVVLFCILGLRAAVTAQENAPPPGREGADATARQTITSQPVQLSEIASAQAPERRPAALMPLYASLVTLQILDVRSTQQALTHGSVEANPLMKGLASNDVGLTAMKIAGTAGIIVASEHMWKRNKVGAVVFMIATNTAMAWVVQHNYRAVR